MDPTTLIVIVALLMIVGLAGVVLPFVPGVPIIWGAAVFYGVAAGFGTVGVTAMVAITALAAAGIAAGLVLPERAGRASGASTGTLLFALVAGVVGFFVIPVFGFPIGACLGILVAQYQRTGDWDSAWRATIAVLKGFGIGLIAELGAGVAMVVVWVAWVVFTR